MKTPQEFRKLIESIEVQEAADGPKEQLMYIMEQLRQLSAEVAGIKERVEDRTELDDLISSYYDSIDPSNYEDDIEDPEAILDTIRAKYGDKIANDLDTGSEKMHFPRWSAPGTWGSDHLANRKPSRITKAGKANKQDVDTLKRTIGYNRNHK